LYDGRYGAISGVLRRSVGLGSANGVFARGKAVVRSDLALDLEATSSILHVVCSTGALGRRTGRLSRLYHSIVWQTPFEVGSESLI
jgi:hypothetical protein